MFKYLFLLFLILFPQLANAQGNARNPCFVNSEGGCTSVSTSDPLPVDATVNASINSFHQESVLAPFTATTGGVSSSAFTAGKTIVVTNAGISNMAYCQLGTGATTSSQPIAPNGGWAAFTSTSETQVTCATSTSTTTINVSVGTGLPTGVGGAIGAATNSSIGATGAAIPAFATFVGIDSGGNLVGWNGQVTANAGTNLNTSALALESGNLATIVSQLGAVTASPTANTVNDRLKTINTTLGSPFQAGGSIGNTAFGISGTLPAFASTPTVNLGTISTAATAANQSSVIGSAGAGTSATSSLLMGSLYNASPITKSDGQQSALQSDVNGYLKVNVAAGGGAGGTSSSFGAAFPSTGTAIGFSDGSNMVAGTVDGSGFIKVNCSAGCAGGSFNNNADGVATSSTNGQAAAWLYGWNGSSFDRLRTDTTNGLWVNVKTSVLPTGAATAAKQPALGTAGSASADVLTVQGIASMTALKVDGTGGTFPVSGTVAATQSGTWNINNISGTISLPTGAATAANQTNVQTPIAPATATATAGFLLAGQYNSTQATFTNGQQGAVQLSSRGEVKIVNMDAAGNARGANVNASNQLSVSIDGASATNISTNLAQVNGTTVNTGNGTASTGTQRVAISSDNTAFSVNPVSATVPVSTMNSASANSGINSASAFVFDDTSPTSITENNFGFARMSANRNQYHTLRDAAGNERGQNVNANNAASVFIDQTTLGTTNGVSIAAVAATATTAPVSTMNSASGAGAVPSAMAGVFDDTSPTSITENNFGYVRMSANRNQYTTIRDSAGNERGVTVNANNALNTSIDQTTLGTTNGVSVVTATTGGSSTAGAIQPNNTTAVVVKASAGTLLSVQAYNIGSGPAYLKIYNATSATCGSGTPVKRLLVPKAGTAADGAGNNITFGAAGVAFGTGITYCVTTGIADNDTTAAASNTVLINVDYK